MLKDKTALVAGATSDIGHTGFGAVDDIDVHYAICPSGTAWFFAATLRS